MVAPAWPLSTVHSCPVLYTHTVCATQAHWSQPTAVDDGWDQREQSAGSHVASRQR